MSGEQIGGIIREMSRRYPLIFAIANTIESRLALGTLKERGVPVVLLVHEFSAYMRPTFCFSGCASIFRLKLYSRQELRLTML